MAMETDFSTNLILLEKKNTEVKHTQNKAWLNSTLNRVPYETF